MRVAQVGGLCASGEDESGVERSLAMLSFRLGSLPLDFFPFTPLARVRFQ